MKLNRETLYLLSEPSALKRHILRVLNEAKPHKSMFGDDVRHWETTSAVLFLLGPGCQERGSSDEPCLILNKRSKMVRQPGDLCCPGGTVAYRLDSFLGRILALPLLPLARWPYWLQWRHQKPEKAHQLATLFATSLRESFEEMRLNPLRVQFLGGLPSQSLTMFQRCIYPMVGWSSRQRRFRPNWEVEKIVYIPLGELLDSDRYARYRLEFPANDQGDAKQILNDYPCFLHQSAEQEEVLWGATYSIVTIFLEMVFGFQPPKAASLPVVTGSLDKNYYGGAT